MSNLCNEVGAGLFVASSVVHNDATVSDINALVAATPGLRLMGWSSKESAGTPAAATFAIKHGATVASGTDMAYVNHALSTSNNQWYGPDGIACPNGISIYWLTGQIDIAVFYKVVT